ncbi:MAG: hypothetical protein Q4B79_03640 [Moraxella sp.]|uniref:hypothetical protein n=1 Tax=Moraxella sp. TaxID=479 RepID=UPI0026DBAC06|nr:hypothetical protein [Moraxella sp.]MDO4450038.1 hypothetical protein [Moraxella sp.]
MTQSHQVTKVDFFLKIFVVITLALLPVACTKGLERQARADYQKCLSWQADGYDIRCDNSKWQ